MIEVKNLNKTFKVHQKEAGLKGSIRSLFNRKYIEKHALSNLDLSIEQGEIIGLIGSNGAGKTTLTKILSGIIHPTSGDVKVMGHNPWERKNEYRRSMAVIMGQKAQLWWDLPAMDGFLLLKEIYQIPSRQFYESIEYLAEYLDIKSQLNIQVRRLSLGERMKVELMAALLHRPNVIYLDEPTIGLDLTAQKAVRRFIKEYRKEFNPTMILTSHYMEDIEELCSRICLLKEGRKIYDGKLSILHEDYAQTKLIVATPQDDSLISQIDFPKELGDLSVHGKRIHINSPRDKTMEATQYLFNKVPLSDFNIQEQEIGDIIESILSDKERI